MISDSKQLENVTDPQKTCYERIVKEKKWLSEGLIPDTRVDSILSVDWTNNFWTSGS